MSTDTLILSCPGLAGASTSFFTNMQTRGWPAFAGYDN